MIHTPKFYYVINVNVYYFYYNPSGRLVVDYSYKVVDVEKINRADGMVLDYGSCVACDGVHPACLIWFM